MHLCNTQSSPSREEVSQAYRDRIHRAYIVHTLLFCGVLFLLGILSLVQEPPTVSAVEKRELAKMPEFSVDALLEGTYVREVELHYADVFPGRDYFVKLAAQMDEWKGVRFDDVRVYGTTPPQEEAPPPRDLPPAPEVPGVIPPVTSREESVPAEQAPAAAQHWQPDDGAVGEKNGAVFVYKEKGMSIFGGSFAMGEWYAQAVSRYAQTWGDRVQVYNAVVPTAIEFALPERYASVSAPQKPNIDHIYASLDLAVRPVDVYGQIAAHTGEYLYFNADHHWTGLGAYYAYRAFCSAAGLTPLELSDYETRRLDNFYGTMYSYTNDAKLASDYVDYYLMPVASEAVRYDKGAPDTPLPHSVWAEYAKSPNSYAVFLHGDFPLIKITTEAGTGRKALMIKESFGNAFAPFLIPHYDEVYVVDQRYFEKNLGQFVLDQQIDDVIFINNIFAANTSYHIECIEGMLAQ